MGVQGKAQRRRMVVHSKELQRRHAPPEPCNPSHSGITKMAMAKKQHQSIVNIMLGQQISGQLRNLGL